MPPIKPPIGRQRRQSEGPSLPHATRSPAAGTRCLQRPHAAATAATADDAAQCAADPWALDILDPMAAAGRVGLAAGVDVEAVVNEPLDSALDPLPVHLPVIGLVEQVDGQGPLRWVQRRVAQHVTHNSDNAAKLLWVGQRSIQRNAAALRRATHDDPLGVAAQALHLSPDEAVQLGAHLQEGLYAEVVLAAAGLIREVVEPGAELDAAPSQPLASPNHPVLEASLLLHRRSWQHDTDRSTADAEVVRAVDVVRALVGEAVQVDQRPTRRLRRRREQHSARVEDHGALEGARLHAARWAHAEVLALDLRAQRLMRSLGRDLERAPGGLLGLPQPVHGATLVPAGPRAAALAAHYVVHSAAALRVDEAGALRLPDANGQGHATAVPRPPARKAAE
mmetsp:Transcript_76307/g.196467  ORF Transcript_76307/g.196467 Transcript_76307/m.196467 type:complete len:394 (-) Transcript_76307:326-1507(-)